MMEMRDLCVSVLRASASQMCVFHIVSSASPLPEMTTSLMELAASPLESQ
jgi:hypothetical protein